MHKGIKFCYPASFVVRRYTDSAHRKSNYCTGALVSSRATPDCAQACRFGATQLESVVNSTFDARPSAQARVFEASDELISAQVYTILPSNEFRIFIWLRDFCAKRGVPFAALKTSRFLDRIMPISDPLKCQIIFYFFRFKIACQSN